jgi:hypothetical protein
MLVYHGSDSNFKQLRIAKSLCKRGSTVHNEGYGIYFTTDLEIAKSYGKYVYILEINDTVLHDFRRKNECTTYVSKLVTMLRKETNINLFEYIDVQGLIDRMYWGGLKIFDISTEILNLLDSTEKYYRATTETHRKKVASVLRRYTKNTLKAYLFTYSIKNIGVIKDVDPSIVKIVSRQQSY